MGIHPAKIIRFLPKTTIINGNKKSIRKSEEEYTAKSIPDSECLQSVVLNDKNMKGSRFLN